MDKDQMIDFLIDNESTEDLKKDLKKYYHQIEKAKEFIYKNYFKEGVGIWTNEDMKQVYYYLEFNNNEIK